MENQREMNFWDLCVAFGRLIGRGCQALWRIGRRMIRLTYHYWWIVLPIVVLAVAAAFYYTRKDNITYRVNAVAMLNGPSIQQFEQTYTQLQTGKMLVPDSKLEQWILERKVTHFTTYHVVDCFDDGTPDYIDFKRKSSPTDTVKVQMQDRLCLEFRIKSRNLEHLPEIEQEVLALFNSNEAMRQSHQFYLSNLSSQAAFNHSQLLKLDSLTTEYYFHNHLGEQPLTGVGTNLIWAGDWRVHLFLEEIYDHQERTQADDYRLQLAYAPVVLENHFAVNPKPLNGRNKSLVIFFLLGWFAACALAEIIDRRKEIAAWLKQK
jgi:hypothetical protein